MHFESGLWFYASLNLHFYWLNFDSSCNLFASHLNIEVFHKHVSHDTKNLRGAFRLFKTE